MNKRSTQSNVNNQRRDLLEAELHRCLKILKEHYQPQKVILFGSMVNDKVEEWSDLDLVIIKETRKRFLDRTKEVMQLLSPRVGMDLIVYTPEEYEDLAENRTFIKQEIVEKGWILYERND